MGPRSPPEKGSRAGASLVDNIILPLAGWAPAGLAQPLGRFALIVEPAEWADWANRTENDKRDRQRPHRVPSSETEVYKSKSERDDCTASHGTANIYARCMAQFPRFHPKKTQGADVSFLL